VYACICGAFLSGSCVRHLQSGCHPAVANQLLVDTQPCLLTYLHMLSNLLFPQMVTMVGVYCSAP
jgi:hypothetical protein